MMQSINNQYIDRGIPLCLSFSNVDAYIIEEKENKYLIFALTENNKEVLEPYKNFGVKLKNKLRQHIVANQLNVRMILRKLNLIHMMMICL